MSIEVVKAFNSLAEEFFGRLEHRFPDENKIVVYKMAFLNLKTNIRKPVEMFMETLIPFGKEILAHDDSFFKQENIVDRAESFSGKLGLLDRWENLTKQTQESIWTYVQNLYILGLSALGMDDELGKIAKR